MANIDLSLLPRLIGVLEELPTLMSLRLKVATLEAQLAEKQLLIDSLQAQPSLPEAPSLPTSQAETDTVTSLQTVRVDIETQRCARPGD